MNYWLLPLFNTLVNSYINPNLFNKVSYPRVINTSYPDWVYSMCYAIELDHLNKTGNATDVNPVNIYEPIAEHFTEHPDDERFDTECRTQYAYNNYSVKCVAQFFNITKFNITVDDMYYSVQDFEELNTIDNINLRSVFEANVNKYPSVLVNMYYDEVLANVDHVDIDATLFINKAPWVEYYYGYCVDQNDGDESECVPYESIRIYNDSFPVHINYNSAGIIFNPGFEQNYIKFNYINDLDFVYNATYPLDLNLPLWYAFSVNNHMPSHPWTHKPELTSIPWTLDTAVTLTLNTLAASGMDYVTLIHPRYNPKNAPSNFTSNPFQGIATMFGNAYSYYLKNENGGYRDTNTITDSVKQEFNQNIKPYWIDTVNISSHMIGFTFTQTLIPKSVNETIPEPLNETVNETSIEQLNETVNETVNESLVQENVTPSANNAVEENLSSSSGKSLSTGQIAGITCGSVAGVAIVAGATVLIIKRRNEALQEEYSPDLGDDDVNVDNNNAKEVDDFEV